MQMVNGVAHGEALTQALIGWPLAYMAACCYYSLFKLGMFSFYHVVPHATNSHSLLMNAAQARRLAPAVHDRALQAYPRMPKMPAVGT